MQTPDASSTVSRAPPRDDGTRASLMLVVLASVLAVVTTRVPTWSHALWAWDSVNFALALDEIDVQRHQPHPPGYIGFVLLARALRWGAGENEALLRAILLASIATSVLTWYLAWRMWNSRAAAWTAWSIVVFSPLHWFYGAVAEVYAVEAATTTAIAAAAYAVGRRWPGADLALACTVFVAALVKLPAVLLMLPLVGVVIREVPARHRLRIGVAVSLAGLLAAGAFALVEPIGAMWRSSSGQVGEVASTSFLANLNHRALNRSLRDMAYAAVAAVGPGVVALVVLGRFVRPSALTFLAVWSAPFLLSSALVHFPKPGYLLPILPPAAMALSSMAVGLSVRRVGVVVLMIAAGGVLQFVAVRPFSLASTGEGQRYADRTVSQRLRTEANSLMRPSWSAIRAGDARVRTYEEAMASRCRPTSRVLVLVEGGGELTWRHAMFYSRHATAVQLPTTRASLQVASGRHVTTRPGTQRLGGDCVVQLLGRTTSSLPDTRDAQPPAEVSLGLQRLEFHQGPAELVLSDGEPHLQ